MAKDAGNSFAKATKVRLKNGKLNLKESLGASDDFDFYRFNLSNRSTFNCSLNRLAGNVELTLFDLKGKSIAVSDEDDGNPESIRRQLRAGSYFLRVKRIEGEQISYRLSSSIVELAGTKFSDALKVRPANNKQPLNGEFTYSGSLSTSGKQRFAFYQFNLTERSNFTSLLEGLTADADIELFNSSRQRILISNQSGTTSELLKQALEAGAYFLKVKIKSGKSKYQLKLSFDNDLGGNTIENAELISLNANTVLAKDAIGGTDAEDYYKVNLTAPSSLNLSLDGLTADANLQLINSSGSIIGTATNPGTAKDLLSTNLAAGTYFVRVFPAASNTSTNYDLSFNLTPLQLFGLTDTNSLVAFNADAPTKAVNIGVTGLATGETLRAIDFRPATEQLYGLSTANKLYKIDLATGAATPTSTTAITPALSGTAVGFDFNPTVDRIRVVSDADENLRLNPDTGAIAATDTPLAYATGDANAAANPNVTASAYTNNFPGSLSTALFGIDTTLDVLVQQGSTGGSPISPNTGTLFTVGALGAGTDFGANTGFDIFTSASLVSTAYVTSGSSLYSVNLSTGAATNLGTVSVGTTAVNLIGFAARPLV